MINGLENIAVGVQAVADRVCILTSAIAWGLRINVAGESCWEWPSENLYDSTRQWWHQVLVIRLGYFLYNLSLIYTTRN